MSDQGPLEFAHAACLALKGAADGSLQWDWDGRFDTAVAAFGVSIDSAIRDVLESSFDRRWSLAEIREAPARVTALTRRLGGMRGNQLLWVTSEDAPVVLFCAWWPWGGGDQVSIRVGYDCDGDSEGPDLKSWFGL